MKLDLVFFVTILVVFTCLLLFLAYLLAEEAQVCDLGSVDQLIKINIDANIHLR